MVYRSNVDEPIMEKSLYPHFFSGFVQSDGCFHIGLEKSSTAKHKIRIKPTFYVTQLNSKGKKISPLLRMARNLLQVGHYVPDRKKNCSSLRVNTLKDLYHNVLPHFEEYPLLSEKKNDYLVFKEIVEKMNKKLHHSKEGFCDIYNLALSMNKKASYRKKYTDSLNPLFDTHDITDTTDITCNITDITCNITDITKGDVTGDVSDVTGLTKTAFLSVSDVTGDLTGDVRSDVTGNVKGCTQTSLTSQTSQTKHSIVRGIKDVKDDKNIEHTSLPFQSFQSLISPKANKKFPEGKSLNAQFVSGLIQGDGSFGFSFRIRKPSKNQKDTNKAKISPFFSLGQEKTEYTLLEECVRFFQCGKIYKVSENYYRWVVSDYSSLKNNILDHLRAFPLLDVKGKHFTVFTECLHILTSKEICEKQKVKRVVECAYNLNMDGKRRRRTKEEYLRAIAS